MKKGEEEHRLLPLRKRFTEWTFEFGLDSVRSVETQGGIIERNSTPASDRLGYMVSRILQLLNVNLRHIQRHLQQTCIQGTVPKVVGS